jgi:hypothetical protein
MEGEPEKETEGTADNPPQAESFLNMRSLVAFITARTYSSSSSGTLPLASLQAQFADWVKGKTGEVVTPKIFRSCVGNLKKNNPQMLSMVPELFDPHASEGSPTSIGRVKRRYEGRMKNSEQDGKKERGTEEELETSESSPGPPRKKRKLGDVKTPHSSANLLSNSLKGKFGRKSKLTSPSVNINLNSPSPSPSRTSENNIKIKPKTREHEDVGKEVDSQKDEGKSLADTEKKRSGSNGGLEFDGKIDKDNKDDKDKDSEDDDENEDENEDDNFDENNNDESEIYEDESSDDDETETDDSDDENEDDNGSKFTKRFSGKTRKDSQKEKGKEKCENRSKDKDENREEEEEEDGEGEEGEEGDEENERQQLGGKSIKDLTLEDFTDPLLIKAIRNKNTVPEVMMQIHYRLANKYMRLVHGAPSGFRPTKFKLSNTARRALHKKATSFPKFWPVPGHFALPGKNERMTPATRARKCFVIKQQRSAQAALRFVMEAMAETMNDNKDAIPPLLDSAAMLLCDQMTAARGELQWMEDPAMAKGLEEEPEDREKVFDDDDDEKIKKKNERQKQKREMHRNAAEAGAGSSRGGSTRGGLFRGRSLARGRGYWTSGRSSNPQSFSRSRRRWFPQTGNDYDRGRESSAGTRRERSGAYAARSSANFESNAWAGGGSNNSDSNYDNYDRRGPNARRARGRGRK